MSRWQDYNFSYDKPMAWLSARGAMEAFVGALTERKYLYLCINNLLSTGTWKYDRSEHLAEIADSQIMHLQSQNEYYDKFENLLPTTLIWNGFHVIRQEGDTRVLTSEDVNVDDFYPKNPFGKQVSALVDSRLRSQSYYRMINQCFFNIAFSVPGTYDEYLCSSVGGSIDEMVAAMGNFPHSGHGYERNICGLYNYEKYLEILVDCTRPDDLTSAHSIRFSSSAIREYSVEVPSAMPSKISVSLCLGTVSPRYGASNTLTSSLASNTKTETILKIRDILINNRTDMVNSWYSDHTTAKIYVSYWGGDNKTLQGWCFSPQMLLEFYDEPATEFDKIFNYQNFF